MLLTEALIRMIINAAPFLSYLAIAIALSIHDVFPAVKGFFGKFGKKLSKPGLLLLPLPQGDFLLHQIRRPAHAALQAHALR